MAEISGLKKEKVRCVASPHPCALRRKSWDQERFFLRRYAFPRFESITRVLGTGVAHLRKWANGEETGRQVRSWGVDTPGLRAHPWKFPRTKRTGHLDGGQGGKRCFAHHPRRWTEPRSTGAGRAAGLGPRTCRWRGWDTLALPHVRAGQLVSPNGGPL